MKDLKDALNEQLQINEAKGLFVLRLEPKRPSGHYSYEIGAVCSSEKAARVWCVEHCVAYDAWKLKRDPKGIILGCVNTQNGDEWIIEPCRLFTQETTDLENVQ